MLMIQSTIDHIVIGAADLEKATKRIEQFIKADFSSGGKHPLMATHNRLIKLQNSIYMEVISIDPSATMPQSSGQKSVGSRLTRSPQNAGYHWHHNLCAGLPPLIISNKQYHIVVTTPVKLLR